MPRVSIDYDPDNHTYYVDLAPKDAQPDEYLVIVDMKSSHYRNMKRNVERYNRDQRFLHNFFVQAQMIGRAIREQ